MRLFLAHRARSVNLAGAVFADLQTSYFGSRRLANKGESNIVPNAVCWIFLFRFFKSDGIQKQMLMAQEHLWKSREQMEGMKVQAGRVG